MTNCINHKSQRKTAKVAGLIYLSEVVFGIFAEIVRSGLVVFTFCIFLTGNVFAQEEETVSATDSSSSGKIVNHAINMCPGGIALGIYSFNYEYLFGQIHGLVGRFDYQSISESYSDDTIKANGFGFTLNYRWHWSGAMESGFLGLFARYRVYNGTGTSGLTKFDFTIPEQTLGLNIGKRWVWNNGLNLTFALGYGISISSTETEPANTSIESTLTTFENEYNFIGPLLGELSIGYAF